MSTSPNAALFERALRVVRAMEAENTRLKAERDLQRGEIALLRQRTERLEQELQADRSGRAELVEQVIDWLEQGEEIVRAGVATVGRERPLARARAEAPEDRREPDAAAPAPQEPEPLAPGQTARAAILDDLAELTGRPRERMTTADFTRTYGGEEKFTF